jgi:DNA invertase Pin-like site-specific DNA recombinase
VADLLWTLREIEDLGIGFGSLTEALDLTTPTGRALAGRLAVFAEFERDIVRERARAGIAHARQQGKPHGRPPWAFRQAAPIGQLCAEGLSKRAIARQLGIGKTSVRRILQATRGG